MRLRWPALTAAIVSLGLAAVAALLALDVDAARDALREGDVQQAAGRAGPEAWDHGAVLPGDLAERMLGVRDDLDYRRAVARFSATRPNAAPAGLAAEDSRDEALAALAAVAGDRDSPTRAAQAANLAGVLAIEGSKAADSAPAQDALALFRSSISSDPGPEHAKRNLERLLRELSANARATGPARERGRFGRRPGGAGLSPPGEGY